MSKLKELEKMLTQGRISRREFLARASALGLAAAVSPTLLRGTARGATPKRGGRLRIGAGGTSTTDSLDPGILLHTMPQTCNQIVRNHLVEIDYKANPIPELAESWEASPDAVQWTFKLRKGVEFHNGKTLDAEDVVFSINYHRGEDSTSAAKGVVDPITDVKADGKNTVIFTLKQGNADFPYIAADYHLAIVPAGTTDFAKGVGTGPFIFVSYEPGVRFVAKRNPNYFKEGRPYFDEVEMLGIADVNARTNALKTGQIDMMNRCELKTVHLLERSPGIQVIKTTGNKHYSVPMLTTIKPYDNNDARLGLKYAVDREHLVKQILRGYGSLGNDHPIGPANRYRATDSELPQRLYDPDKAKCHLKRAGLLDHTFKLHAADAAFSGAVDAAVLYKEHAAKAGVKINVVREPDDGYWENVWIKKEWVMCYWSGRATEDWMFSIAYAEDASWNDTHWKHEKFNKLLNAGRAELDDKKRREMYVEMQRIVRDEGATVVPMFAMDLQGATDKLQFENVAGNWEFDGLRMAERWWFA
jgi:peptide/nickel transport system substrate-binding protein